MIAFKDYYLSHSTTVRETFHVANRSRIQAACILFMNPVTRYQVLISQFAGNRCLNQMFLGSRNPHRTSVLLYDVVIFSSTLNGCTLSSHCMLSMRRSFLKTISFMKKFPQ